MNTQIFLKIKYDLKCHGSSHEAFLAKFFLSHSFIHLDKKKFKYNCFLKLDPKFYGHIKSLMSY